MSTVQGAAVAEAAVTVCEGGVRLRLSANHESPSGRRSGGGAFFNPRMRCNRAFVAASLAAFVETRDPAGGPVDCLDGFAASGAMALQWKLRLGARVRVLAVDRCPEAVAALEANCELNGVLWRRVRPHEVPLPGSEGPRQLQVAMEQVNSVMEACPFDFVHLDPFGSPAGNIEAALRHLRNGGLLSITCTDVASLLGQHPQVALRNYGAVLIRTRYSTELAVRALLAFVASCAGRCGKAIRPLYCLSAHHFLLMCVRVERGARRADDCLARWVGRLAHCRVCEERARLPSGAAGIAPPTVGCECGVVGGGATVVLGPIWHGDLFDADFVQRMARHLQPAGDGEVEKPLAPDEEILLRLLIDEAQCKTPVCGGAGVVRSGYDAAGDAAVTLTPPFYVCPKWLKLTGVDLPKMSQLIDTLKRNGYVASRTHFDLAAVRTNASAQACRDLILRSHSGAADATADGAHDSSMNCGSNSK